MKYMSRPMEVEAEQYLTEQEAITRLIALVGNERTVKHYIDLVPAPNGGLRMALTLKTASDRYVLVEGDWLVLNPHGGIEVWTNEAFEERFVI